MRSDYDGRSLRNAMIKEGLSIAGLAALFPFGFLRSRHQPKRARDLHTLVFVHGLAANRATFYPLQSWLKLRGHGRQYSFNHRSGPCIEALAIQLKREIDAHVKGGRISLIAHSLGGLVARAYLQLLGGERRVERLITLGTPHHGTWASKFLPTPLLGQLNPGSPFLAHLNSLPPPVAVRAHSFAAGDDALILPRESALLPYGDRQIFKDAGHNNLLWSPAVFLAVRAALEGYPVHGELGDAANERPAGPTSGGARARQGPAAAPVGPMI